MIYYKTPVVAFRDGDQTVTMPKIFLTEKIYIDENGKESTVFVMEKRLFGTKIYYDKETPAIGDIAVVGIPETVSVKDKTGSEKTITNRIPTESVCEAVKDTSTITDYIGA